MTDQLVVAHLTKALIEHRRWCRSRGHQFPPLLEAILDALAASAGPERPAFDEMPDSAETDRVLTSPLLLTDADAALRLNVSERTVRRLRARGTLPAVLVGRRRFTRLADVEDFVANGGV